MRPKVSVCDVGLHFGPQWLTGLRPEIVFTAYKRPQYFKETLESWAQVRGIKDIPITVFLEPSDVQDEMVEVALSVGLRVEVVLNPTKLGVLGNPWQALSHGFSRGNFVILAEEDLIVSTDTLEYFAAVTSRVGPEEALGVCAHTMAEAGDPAKWYMEERFEVLLWGTWEQNWREVIRDTWDKDYSTHDGVPGQHAGWDWNLGRISRQRHKPFVIPEVSRSKHIGQFDGRHTTPESFAAESTPTFQLTRVPVRFSHEHISDRDSQQCS